MSLRPQGPPNTQGLLNTVCGYASRCGMGRGVGVLEKKAHFISRNGETMKPSRGGIGRTESEKCGAISSLARSPSEIDKAFRFKNHPTPQPGNLGALQSTRAALRTRRHWADAQSRYYVACAGHVSCTSIPKDATPQHAHPSFCVTVVGIHCCDELLELIDGVGTRSATAVFCTLS